LEKFLVHKCLFPANVCKIIHSSCYLARNELRVFPQPV
jgi:hypothetical protein